MTRYYIINTGVFGRKSVFSHILLYDIIHSMRIRKDSCFLPSEELDLISRASDALAHPLRVELFHFIYSENVARRQVCNKTLVQEFGYSQSTISQHMNKLLVSGLVEVRKKESFSFYYVNLGVLGRYLDCVRKLNIPG